ncbi:MAG TPA: hypothetical protein VLA56_19550 [Pseudomonadales bacterium]|nr:hypothetical protein [Pseudomonadales bacterium]
MVGKVMDEVSGSTGEQEAKTTAPPPMERTDTCVALTEMGLLPAQTEAEREAVRQAGGQHCLER